MRYLFSLCGGHLAKISIILEVLTGNEEDMAAWMWKYGTLKSAICIMMHADTVYIRGGAGGATCIRPSPGQQSFWRRACLFELGCVNGPVLIACITRIENFMAYRAICRASIINLYDLSTVGPAFKLCADCFPSCQFGFTKSAVALSGSEHAMWPIVDGLYFWIPLLIDQLSISRFVFCSEHDKPDARFAPTYRCFFLYYYTRCKFIKP